MTYWISCEYEVFEDMFTENTDQIRRDLVAYSPDNASVEVRQSKEHGQYLYITLRREMLYRDEGVEILLTAHSIMEIERKLEPYGFIPSDVQTSGKKTPTGMEVDVCYQRAFNFVKALASRPESPESTPDDL